MSATELVFRDDAYAKSCTARIVSAEPGAIRLNRTVFYPAGGGQPGDRGTIRLISGQRFEIVDTIKGATDDDVIHVPAEGAQLPPAGIDALAEIDWARRRRHMRIHTCLHLLTAVVAAPVTGGQIAEDKGRLDFDLQDLEITLDKNDIETKLNALIGGGAKAAARWISDEELSQRPELVKTMLVKPPSGQGRVRLMEIDGIDLQPCGGTHIANVAEIGAIKVLKIESKGKRNRRVTIGFAE
ncbi:MAG: alanyl-tRNA editing protein [Alphaproteobacteria bacterium]|nr:alanyl-tRNA editing protein [Alphaproteobacteria bacterium]